MPAAKRTLYIEQGATFRLGFNWHSVLVDGDGNPILDGAGQPQPGAPIDLTGATGRMQIRPTLVGSALISATTGGSGPGSGTITLGTTNGRVDIKFPASLTDTLTTEAAVYDLEIVLPDGGEGDVQRVLQGPITVSLNVTRAGA
jgi:hypothetical protein